MGSNYITLNIRLCLLHIVGISNAQIQFDIRLCNVCLSVRHIQNIRLAVLCRLLFFYVKTIICFDHVVFKIERVIIMIKKDSTDEILLKSIK